MKFYIFNKKHIIIFVSIILILTISFLSYSIYASYSNTSYCYPDSIFCVSSLIDFKGNFSTSIQQKIDSIYTSNEKVAYLTFDDGPTKVATTQILDILKKEDIKATFFVIGYRVKEFPNTVKRAYDEGHFIANHGYDHNNKKMYSSEENFKNEIEKTDDAIGKALGIDEYCSHVFRFPNGYMSSNNKYQKTCYNGFM